MGIELSPYQKKSVHCLYENISKFINIHGVQQCGFLTLTFADNVIDNKEASRRFNNFNRRFLSQHFDQWILVKERQFRGAWHYHILVNLPFDIKTNFDFKQIQNKNYSSARPELKTLWKLLRENMQNYGFGRAELLPIKSNADGMARYMAKYMSKYLQNRNEQDKGVRLVSYNSTFSKSTPKFSWLTEGGTSWRMNLSRWASIAQIKNISGFKKLYGINWAFKMVEYIIQLQEFTDSDIYYLHHLFLSGSIPAIKHFQPRHFINDDGKFLDSITGEILF